MLHRRGDKLTVSQREYILTSQKQRTDELEKERQRTTELRVLLETVQRQKQMALARGLAAQAVLYSQYDRDPSLIERSILLAIESLRRFPPRRKLIKCCAMEERFLVVYSGYYQVR